MNCGCVDALLKATSEIRENCEGFWDLDFQGRRHLVLVDEEHNRMRIMTLVRSATDLDREELLRLMEANFHSALDARYAVHDGVLWSIFQHTFTDLSPDQFLDGLNKVCQLAENYGGSYASTDIIFNG